MGWFGSERVRKRVRDLEERVEQLELRAAQDRLGVLEVIERVTKRLEWRERKRADAAPQLEDPTEDESSHALGFARRFRNHDRGS